MEAVTSENAEWRARLKWQISTMAKSRSNHRIGQRWFRRGTIGRLCQSKGSLEVSCLLGRAARLGSLNSCIFLARGLLRSVPHENASRSCTSNASNAVGLSDAALRRYVALSSQATLAGYTRRLKSQVRCLTSDIHSSSPSSRRRMTNGSCCQAPTKWNPVHCTPVLRWPRSFEVAFSLFDGFVRCYRL